MAEDLAIDVGFEIGTDDYKSFVACISNILDYGCSYSEAKTQEIVDKCGESDLDIAKDVIHECRKSRTGIRQTKLKWWQTLVPQRSQQRPQRRRPMSPRRRPMSPRRPRRGTQRRMELSFSKKQRNDRPDRPSNGRDNESVRPMSYDRPSDDRDNESVRPMSPLYQSREWSRPNKRRRR